MQDFIVIGGGPAGSTISTYLAQKGHSVTVLEKEKFPRDHVGESLLPFCYDIFNELGLLEEMKNRFVRKPGVRFVDVDGSHSTTWCFGHVIKDESYLSFHVLRPEFDDLLLNNARKHGVTAKEQTRVTSVDLNSSEGSVTIHATGPRGGKQTHNARFLIDASGRDTFMATRMQWKSPHDELDRAALSTHWAGARYTEGIEEGLLQIVYLGGEKKGWIWVIPVGTDRLSIGVVLNHAYIRQRRAEIESSGVADWQQELYRSELMSSDFVRDIVSDAHTIMPLMFNGDYSYKVAKKFGPNFALVGDASTFIDPIFASGIYLSLNSARLVANALHEKFTSGNGAGESYLEEAYDQINGAYQLVDKAIRLFYNPKAINFAQVGSVAGLIHANHENALAVGHYLLAGDFFERHEEYSRFIDLLQDDNLYARYKRLVIDRPDFQASTCGTDRFEVFHAFLKDDQRAADIAGVSD